jgi:cathepsin L
MIDTLTFTYLKYVAQWGKSHLDMHDFNARLQNFVATHMAIEEINATESHVAGHNQFSDWHHVEYKQMLGYVKSETAVKNIQIFEETNASSVNWVEAGAVTAVKNQGSCGSCWAFSSTGSIEGAHFVATGELLSFSEQQLVDCSTIRYGNMGCNGGLQSGAYRYYESHAAELETVYPYTSGNGDDSTSCLAESLSATAVEVSSYVNVTPSNSAQMKAALDTQPLAVAIEADKMVFQTYHSGVLTSSKCGTNLDHAVLAVGYGTEDGQDYWLVKNSWDTTWGDQGYIKLGMDSSDGACGVQIDPQAPSTN